jgi:2-polyprenyl-6-methoxyphenol hydroxylase-like FAD-dependent oxidoreductase
MPKNRQDDRRVRVAFGDGSCGDYDLVVGADGIGSTVRRLAVSDVVPTRTRTVGWRCVVAGRPAGVEHLVLLLGEGCFLGLVPVGGGQTYGFAGTGAAAGRRRRPRDAPAHGSGRQLDVEDALVLADELARADTLPSALSAHARRRRPRVDWIQEQSRRAAAAWALPAAERDAALRAHGDRLLQERYRPLRKLP